MKLINQRINKLRHIMNNNDIEAFLVSKPENIRYLSKFSSGSDAKLLISQDKQYIITDSRYIEQVKTECLEWELFEIKAGYQESWQDLALDYKNLAFESHHLTYLEYLKISKNLSKKLQAQEGLIESLRLYKDEAELLKMREIASIGDRVFDQICQKISIDWSEKAVADLILSTLREYGCEKEAFDVIAVSGKNASLPHGKPSQRKLQKGDMLTLDYGGFLDGYVGDMTRTVFLGDVDKRWSDYYTWLLEAQELGLSLLKPGIKAKDLDQEVRASLSKHDIDKFFIHSLGHGLGLEVHEQPRISSISDIILRENMVVTIEPGIYIPGQGGIRIEDTVIINKDGCEAITKANKNILIL